MSHVTASSELAHDEGALDASSPDLTPGRRGFLKTTLLGQPQAIVGLTVVVLFILIAILHP